MFNSIAFIGSAGIPNNYGGFEMFLECCAPQLASRFGSVIVTCDKSRYPERDVMWRGVHRIFVPIAANGFTSVIHDLVAFLRTMRRANVIIVLGVSGGIFFPLFRALSLFTGAKLIVNVDGVEWRRGKFSRAKRAFLYVSDRLAQWLAHEVVVDNEALRPYLIPSVREKATYIPYPGDQARAANSMVTRRDSDEKFCLTICRIEPENNCDLLIEAFSRVGRGSYVFIGNWNNSEYGRELRRRYNNVPNLEMRDPVYDKQVLAKLRENCTNYLHGHSVGGTNPSLVEMLFYDCDIFAFDCTFNRASAGDAVEYFCSVDELVQRIRDSSHNRTSDRIAVRNRYTCEHVSNAYESLIEKLLSQEKDVESEYLAFSEDDSDSISNTN